MVMWIYLNVFVKEDDILADLLTKVHPDQFLNLREAIKTTVH
jgi:hypothetical protein